MLMGEIPCNLPAIGLSKTILLCIYGLCAGPYLGFNHSVQTNSAICLPQSLLPFRFIH